MAMVFECPSREQHYLSLVPVLTHPYLSVLQASVLLEGRAEPFKQGCILLGDTLGSRGKDLSHGLLAALIQLRVFVLLPVQKHSVQTCILKHVTWQVKIGGLWFWFYVLC